MANIGRWLIICGVSIAIFGVICLIGGRIGLARLPGDFVVNRGEFTLFVPIATSIVLSVGLTVVLNLLARWRR